MVLAVPIVKSSIPIVIVKDSNYSAKFISQNDTDPIEISVGESKTVTFTFKNTGKTTWDSSGQRFISAYTMEPRNRSSVFANKDWISSKQTTRVVGKVKPGAIGILNITFNAPTKVGEYTEKFYLASENNTWIKGGYFFVKIKVTEKNNTTNEIKNNPLMENPLTVSETVNRIFLNPKQIIAIGGEPITIRLGYQNIGKASWNNYTIESRGPANIADGTWQTRTQVLKKDIAVSPNDFLRDTFVLRAPTKIGIYQISLTVIFNGNQTATISIPITVTNDAPPNYQEFFPSDVTPPPSTVYDFLNEDPRLPIEPRIRVGVWKDPTKNTVRFISADDDYQIYGGAEWLGVLARSTPATLTFNNGIYTINSDLFSTSSNQYLRLVPSSTEHAIFTLTNFDRPYSGRPGRNFNRYRGVLELRQAQDQNNSLYAINELTFEDYMSGIGENSNTAPIEYLKAQTVAQRTYAYYTQQNTNKHDSRNFDVVAHTGDQLYLGVENESAMPRFLDAVTATRGLMVTYNNDVVVTPYFGNTDGRTRSWAEVWGGNKPWLVSVPATYDARDGKKLFGHGVGMSQRDAAYRAEEEGLDWVQLIKYYYSGVELHKIY